jgi:hypothetical protein
MYSNISWLITPLVPPRVELMGEVVILNRRCYGVIGDESVRVGDCYLFFRGMVILK